MKQLTLREAVLEWARGKKVEAAPCNHPDDWSVIDPVGGGFGSNRYTANIFNSSNTRSYIFRLAPEPKSNEVPEKEVDLLKAALVRCITIIQCSHGIATETEEWASSSDAMKRILAIDAVAEAKKALHGIPH